jgi:hypothetical protein
VSRHRLFILQLILVFFFLKDGGVYFASFRFFGTRPQMVFTDIAV